jgi:hypothetical protein
MFRYTEEELRGFLETNRKLWREEAVDSEAAGYPEEVAYARGAYQAYDFVLNFMEEYKLEEGGK